MAQPLLDFLTGSARRALPFLRSAAAKGLSANAAIAGLRQLDIGVQRQRVLDIYAVLQNRANPERIARLAGENTTIPVDVHTPAPVDIANPFQYVIEANIEGEATGDYLTVVSTVPLSPRQIREQGVFLFNGEDYRDLELGPLSTVDIQIIEANASTELTSP